MTKEKKIRYVVILFFGLIFIFALIFFISKLSSFLEGERGQIRGAIIFFMSTIFALSLFFSKKRIARFAAFSVICISLIGAIDLICHAPGSSVFGLSTRHPSNFDINFFGARELYLYRTSPYGIEGRYQLLDYSVSFPFPTYAIYWICSGFGHLGKSATGLTFTIVNLFAAFLIVLVSLMLTNIKITRLRRADNMWLILIILFTIPNSFIWGVVMMGQTSVIAACLLIIGLWYSRKHSIFYVALSALFLSIGTLIKPNFAIFLFYFIGIWIEDLHNTSVKNKKHHYLLIFLFSLLFVILFISITILVPSGVGWVTYLEFKNQIVPLLEKIQVPKGFNISLIGLIDELLPVVVSPTFVSIILAGPLIIFGIYKRMSWPYWLVIPLIVSPITWVIYTVILLPAQLCIAGGCIKESGKSFDLALLIISVGMLYIWFYGWAFIGTIGLMIIFFLTLRLT